MIYKGAEITSNKSTQTLHKAVQYFLFWCIITGVFPGGESLGPHVVVSELGLIVYR